MLILKPCSPCLLVSTFGTPKSGCPVNNELEAPITPGASDLEELESQTLGAEARLKR